MSNQPTGLPLCTHGGDCTVHPDAQGIHDFTPSAAQALRQVRDYFNDSNNLDARETVRTAAEQVAADLGVVL